MAEPIAWLADDGDETDLANEDSEPEAKRPRTFDLGPTDYEGSLRFARHQVQAATSVTREWKHG
eukprot:3941966-Heterocapsa_arctica.AAC.1